MKQTAIEIKMDTNKTGIPDQINILISRPPEISDAIISVTCCRSVLTASLLNMRNVSYSSVKSQISAAREHAILSVQAGELREVAELRRDGAGELIPADVPERATGMLRLNQIGKHRYNKYR